MSSPSAPLSRSVSAPGNAAADAIERAKRDWLRTLRHQDADDLLFRFETLLKALDRFFNIQNHPRRRGGPITVEDPMSIEIGVADRRLRALLRMTEAILNEADTSAFVFRSYVETQLISDVERTELLQRHAQQATPLESLYMLQIGLRSLVHLTEGLLKAEGVRVTAFQALGYQYTQLLLNNRFFNPLRERGFDVRYDRVDHALLQRCVRNAPSEGVRRGLSFLLLTLNRLLKICRWISPSATTVEEFHDALPILALLRSEFRVLIPFLENRFTHYAFEVGPRTEQERALAERADALAFQLSMESRKVFEQLLLDYAVTRHVGRLRAGLEAAHGLLNTFLQQAVVSAVQVVLPEVTGPEIYSDFVGRLEQSRRLRQDLWIFHEILRNTVAVVGDRNRDPLAKRVAYQTLMEYINYFQNLSFQLIRAADHETFEHFFADLRALKQETFTAAERAYELARNWEHFRIFLETTLGHVGQRAELRNEPIDEAQARRVLEQFIREG